MPVTQIEQPPPSGPTMLRLFRLQREPYVGSTVFVNAEVEQGGHRVNKDLRVTVTDPIGDVLEHKLENIATGEYIISHATEVEGLYSIRVATTDSAPVVEMVDFWVRG